MSSLVVYGAIALALLGFGGWTGSHFTAQHYQIIIDRAQHDSDLVIAEKQAQIIALQKERAAILAQEATDHAILVQTNADTRRALDARVRSLTAALQRLALPTTVGNPSGGLGTGTGHGSTGPVQPGRGELVAAFEELNLATDALVGACQHDAREVTGILKVAPK